MFQAYPVPQPKVTTQPPLQVDYTGFKAGMNVGHRKVLVECSCCAAIALPKHNDRNLVFIHCEEISLRPNGEPKRTLISVCREKRSA